MTAVIRNIISAVILVALTYLILQALPAAIDQNLKSYGNHDPGVNRRGIVARWSRP